MGTIDLAWNTWEDDIDIGGCEVPFKSDFIINCDAGGFSANVRLVNIKLGGTDDIIHILSEAVTEVIERDILDAAVADEEGYFKEYSKDNQPYDEDEQPAYGYNGSVTQ